MTVAGDAQVGMPPDPGRDGTERDDRSAAGTLMDLGPSWSVRQTVVVDGVESPACVASFTTS
ncbi:MAG: hypothetical protein ACOH17_13710 [Cellulomonas sp.]